MPVDMDFLPVHLGNHKDIDRQTDHVEEGQSMHQDYRQSQRGLAMEPFDSTDQHQLLSDLHLQHALIAKWSEVRHSDRVMEFGNSNHHACHCDAVSNRLIDVPKKCCQEAVLRLERNSRCFQGLQEQALLL